MKLPKLGDSISDATIAKLYKSVGQKILPDEVLAEVETDKVNVEIKSEGQGVITNIFAAEGQKLDVGANFIEYDTEGHSTSEPKKEEHKQEAPKKVETKQETVTEMKKPEIIKPEIIKHETKTQEQKSEPKKEQKQPTPPVHFPVGSRNQRKEPMSRIRQRIAERLKGSQNTYATLTTFNEVDMSEAMGLRTKYQEEFLKKYGVKLGFNSFFLRAASIALQEMPSVNAVIDGTDIIYRDYVDISVAVATPTGLMVPVIRNCESKSFADFELSLKELSVKAKDNKIGIEDMTGGTFTISNGGVYGSMMGTPIINPPQTAILGLHNITNRPICKGEEIVARPMM